MHRLLEDGGSLRRRLVHVPWKQSAERIPDGSFLRRNTGLLPELQYFLQPMDERDLRPNAEGGGDHIVAELE